MMLLVHHDLGGQSLIDRTQQLIQWDGGALRVVVYQARPFELVGLNNLSRSFRESLLLVSMAILWMRARYCSLKEVSQQICAD
jgi:hypothetical protein